MVPNEVVEVLRIMDSAKPVPNVPRSYATHGEHLGANGVYRYVLEWRDDCLTIITVQRAANPTEPERQGGA